MKKHLRLSGSRKRVHNFNQGFRFIHLIERVFTSHITSEEKRAAKYLQNWKNMTMKMILDSRTLKPTSRMIVILVNQLSFIS